MYLFMRGPLRSQQSSNDAANNDVKCTFADPKSWCKGSGKQKEISDLAATNDVTCRDPRSWDWMRIAQTLYGFGVLIIGVSLLIMLAISDKFVLNNQYSAKTLHIEKQNDRGSADRKWNSLGGMTPYVELELLSQSTDNVHGPVAYKIWEDFSHDKRSLESRDNFFRGKHYGPENFEMFINNPWALSVLSSISPVMYLMTLVCVFILSFVGCVITQQMRITSNNEKYKVWLPTLKISIERITLIVFAIAVFVRIARQGTLASILWGDYKIHYMSAVQIPSVLYSLIILGLYYIHLQRTDKHQFWANILDGLFGPIEKKVDQSEANATIMPPEQMTQETNMRLFNSMLYPAASKQITQQSAVMKNMSYEMRVFPQDFKGKLKTQNLMPVTFEYLGAKATDPVPVTDEISILVCMILLLGGLADLGMLNGFILEFEAQLIIISIVSFCVLEISRMQFNSYLVYCLEVWAEGWGKTQDKIPFDDIIFNLSVFVDITVLFFQMFFLWIWQSTRNKIIIQQDDNFNTSFNNCLLAEVIVYMLIKFCLWVWKVICFGYNFKDRTAKFTKYTEPDEAVSSVNSAFSKCFGFLKSFFDNCFVSKFEYVFYLLSIIVFFGVILSMLNADSLETSEGSLIQNEQRMYQSSNRVNMVNSIDQATKSICVLPATAFQELFMYKDMCKDHKEPWGGPVAMKVFAWTRFLVLQDLILGCKMTSGVLCPPASALFCANGFEHEWGKCKQPREQPTWKGLAIKTG